MARPKNPNNVYSLTCKVTGQAVPTNPKQFRELADRYKVTDEELKGTYVSRLGRRQLADEKLTPEQASEKYGIMLSVANMLKCTVKPKAEKTEKVVAPTTEVAVEVTGETSTESTDSTEASTPAAIEAAVDAGVKFCYDSSVDEPETENANA